MAFVVVYRSSAMVRPVVAGDGYRVYGSTAGYAGLRSPATGPSVDWTLPAADASGFWKSNGSAVCSIAALVADDYPTMVGDAGAGGTKGAVPPPGVGDAAAGKFLKADATWAVPPGGGGGASTALDNLAAVAVSLALTPGADNSIAVNSAAKRYTIGYASDSWQVLAAASDANPTAKIAGAGLYAGAGGASAVDTSFLRSAAGAWTAGGALTAVGRVTSAGLTSTGTVIVSGTSAYLQLDGQTKGILLGSPPTADYLTIISDDYITLRPTNNAVFIGAAVSAARLFRLYALTAGQIDLEAYGSDANITLRLASKGASDILAALPNAASSFTVRMAATPSDSPIIVMASDGTTRLWQVHQSGAVQWTEQTAPSAPATNNALVYAEDNGSGKTRLMVLFPTGAAQQLAIEP